MDGTVALAGWGYPICVQLVRSSLDYHLIMSIVDHRCSSFRYPSVLFVNFPEGVRRKRFWTEMNFKSPDGEEYVVTQIVQYLHRKRHFILWSFNYKGKDLICLCSPVGRILFSMVIDFC